MNDILGTKHNFRSLSMKDLLQARDLYHYHLLNKANVVGMAVGLYLIRKADPTPDEEKALCRSQGKAKVREMRKRTKGERTLDNSEVREYSWPCVLALVRNWVDESQFGGEGGELHPEQMVPKTLYMPDGRMVPVCVVKVEQGAPDARRQPEWHWPGGLFGGGMPIMVEPQQQVRQATAGCLVTDGHTTYALTSRHVCGAEDEPVYTLSRGDRVEIGRASRRHLTRVPFTEIYPEFAGHRTYVNLDVGLIELSDLNQWTSQILGLDPIGALADLNELNITTRLIDAPVIAVGAASGRLEGRIKALFYRYKSVGGYDYVSDFLIAPRQRNGDGSQEIAQTQPGDSGAVWHLYTNQKKTRDDEGWCEDDDFDGDLRPLALEWGGQVFVEKTASGSYAFALATSLTTVCKTLDVELVLEHNTGVLPYWGQMGHYSIATFACDALPDGTLKLFMKDNIHQISFSIGNLSPKEMAKRIKEAKENDGLIPLADVPDLVWKKHKTKVKGGRDTRWLDQGRTTGPEHPVHYADIDEKREDGKSLLELCLANPDNISVEFWQQFYEQLGHTEQHERGLLPFRVWQFFDAMKEAAAAGEADRYLCAAGLLSHYVGDACQPLHGSIYADGYKEEGTGKGVHSTYETNMLDRHAVKIVDGIKEAIKESSPHLPLPQISSGKEAAAAIIALMSRSAKNIPPRELVDAYIEAGGTPTAAVRDALWEQFGDQTVTVMTDGAQVLARIWEGAWAEGGGDAILLSNLGVIDPALLMGLYRNLEFVESLDLDQIGPILR
jgi:hypothetical protein